MRPFYVLDEKEKRWIVISKNPSFGFLLAEHTGKASKMKWIMPSNFTKQFKFDGVYK